MKNILYIIIAGFLSVSCKKYLDKSPDKQLVIPSKVSELQAMLDYSFRMNTQQVKSGELSSDNYYLLYNDWQALTTAASRHQYLWEAELYYNTNTNEWRDTYNGVYITNVVLEEIEKIVVPGNPADWNNAKGSALLYRSNFLWKALQLWSKAYDASTAATDLGVPLRLDPDFNVISKRASVQECYNRVIADAKESIALLPVSPVHVFRPSRPGAYALLARIYLSMRDYNKAGLYADSCLQLFSTLLDYNTLSNTNFPFSRFNKETIFHTVMASNVLNNPTPKMDSMLVVSYDNNDLRKTLFLKSNNNGTYAFKGSYEGSVSIFTGIATDEVYLVRAECRARANNLNGALQDLNTLMVTRWKTGTFVPFTASTAAQALDIILTERRKELLMRDLRWTDIKRLNKEGRNITLKRIMNGITYELPPNDPRFALPLPQVVLGLTGMPQNPR